MFVASLFHINQHHDYKTLGPTDTVRQESKSDGENVQREQDSMILSANILSTGIFGLIVLQVEPLPADQFRADQQQLARDMIEKEQMIEGLITLLPGLKNNEQDQERRIRQLEEELKIAEEERKQAVKGKEEVLARLDTVIRSVERP
jgi:mediator of RNA polymerase II transcription subunit 21